MLGYPKPPARILVVDDEEFVREGLRVYLESQGFQVRDAADAETAWRLAGEWLPHAATIDISLPPDASEAPWPQNNLGLQLARRLKAAYPSLGIVLLSAYEYYLDDFMDMLKDGARGLAYKLKGRRSKPLLGAIQRVLDGHVEIDPEVRRRQPATLAEELLRQLTADERQWVEHVLARFDDLTEQEKRAAHLLAASYNTQGIGARLHFRRPDNLISRVYSTLGLDAVPVDKPHLRRVAILVKACMIRDLLQGERDSQAPA